MGLSFANAAGLWALLGVPTVLAIHFLQTRSPPREISTLFLLEMLPEESKKGAVFSRLRNSLQLWANLLAVLLLAFLLAQPRWMRPESVQSVALVLDATANLQAFQDRLQEKLPPEMRRLAGMAAATEWWVMDSSPGSPVLYRGETLAGALAALDLFEPRLGLHDPREALGRARDLTGPDGVVIWVTAHPPAAVPSGAWVLGVGEPAGNAGFTGGRIETDADGAATWVASLLYRGPEPSAVRELRLHAEGQPAMRPMPVDLPEGRVVTLRGPVPADADRIVLRLDADMLPVDDALPLMRPRPKHMTYALQGLSGRSAEWALQVMGVTPHTAPAAGEDPDLVWRSFEGAGLEDTASGIFVYTGETEGPPGQVVAEGHTLTRELGWGGFVGRPHPGFETLPEDRVLVWMEDLPLVVLRERGAVRQLILCFHPERGNATRLPAVLLTINRFLERHRRALPRFEAILADTGERIFPAVRPDGPEMELRFTDLHGETETRTLRPGAPVTAPDRPGFLDVQQGNAPLMSAAVRFGDAAATDLRRAEAAALPEQALALHRERYSQSDWLTPLWFVLLSLCLFSGWLYADRNS